MAKELASLNWVEELLPQDYLRKRMFGGFAYYIDEKLMLLMFESEGNKTYQGQKFDFEIWNGCMFPVEKERQAEVLEVFPFLFPHPVLGKWLYIPMETEDFDSNVQSVLREIRRKNELFGTIPKAKGSKAKVTKKKAKAQDEEEIIDTRRPRMFSDEPGEKSVLKAKKISDLKNLGPESERTFSNAGIKTAPQLVQMGWKKAMVKLCKSNPKNNHSIFAYAVIGALENRMWHLISEDSKREAREFMKSLRDRDKAKAKLAKAKKRKSKS